MNPPSNFSLLQHLLAKPANTGLRLLFAVLIVIAGPACTQTAGASPGRPDDDQDDVSALQQLIDEKASAGGGVVALPAGQFDISRPLVLRSRVILEGHPGGTVISNVRFVKSPEWGGTVVFAGAMTPASYHENSGRGYPGRKATIVGSNRVRIEPCDGPLPQPGQPVWLGTTAGTAGAGGFFRPAWGEITLVREVSGCELLLEDRVTIPGGNSFQVHWSDGSLTEPRSSTVPNTPVVGAGLRRIALASRNGQALIVSGCYACRFEGIRIISSRRLLMIEGSRHTVYDGITGQFRERGIEFAMYATDNVVRNVDARLAGDHIGIRPAIRFGEHARRNRVEDVRLNLGRAYFGRRDKIRLDDAADNTLARVRLQVNQLDRWPLIFTSRPDPSYTVQDVRICNAEVCRPADATP